MKRKSFLIMMGVVFVSLMTLVLFVKELPTVFSSVMAFPFEQLSAGLRILALTGKLGNGLALAICAALSLLPMLLALRHKGERAFLGENLVLYCTGIIVFIVLLSMANPSGFISAFPYLTAELLPVVKGAVGCTAWSFIILWFVLRLVRMFRSGDTSKLLGYLQIALYALCILFDAGIALSCGSALLDDLSSTQQSMDGMMAVLRFVASALPYVLNIIITFSLLALLNAYMEKDEEKTVRNTNQLSRRCCLALIITAVSTVALNVIQLSLSGLLSDVSVNVGIPVVSLAFTLLILLLARFIVENRKLQSDNDLFI